MLHSDLFIQPFTCTNVQSDSPSLLSLFYIVWFQLSFKFVTMYKYSTKSWPNSMECAIKCALRVRSYDEDPLMIDLFLFFLKKMTSSIGAIGDCALKGFALKGKRLGIIEAMLCLKKNNKFLYIYFPMFHSQFVC